MDKKIKKKIDYLLQAIMTKPPVKAKKEKEILLTNLMRVSPESFYAFHELVRGIIDKKCNVEAFSNVLMVLASLKTVLWSCRLMDYEEEVRYGFFKDLKILDEICKNYFDAEQMRELDPDTKTYYSYLYTLLCNYSNDLLVIYSECPFSSPVHIKCGRCGNDIHSILVNPEEMKEENAKSLTQRKYEIQKDGLNLEAVQEMLAQEKCTESATVDGTGETDCNEWDFFLNVMRFLNACGEEYLYGVLQYFYGTHTCAKCGEDECVMTSCRNWLYQEQEYMKEPSEELIDWLEKKVKEQSEAWKGETEGAEFDAGLKEFLCRMLVWYEKSRIEPDYARMYRYMQKTLNEKSGEISVRIRELQFLARQLKQTEYKEILAEVYMQLGAEYRFNYVDEEANRMDLSLAAVEAAIQAYEAAGMKEDKRYWDALISYSVTVAESEEGSVKTAEQQLLERLRLEQQKEEPDMEQMGETYNKLAYLFAEREGDYEKVYAYYEEWLNFVRKKYGEESDYAADCYEELADYHEEAEDIETACRLREKALEINIRIMGKMYLLPPVFRGIAASVAALAKKVDDPDNYDRVMSVADSYVEVGETYYEIERHKEAMGCFEKALSLYEWEFKGKPPITKMAEAHYWMGNIYEDAGDRRRAEKEYQTAIDICRELIERDEYESEVAECEELLEEIHERMDSGQGNL